MTKKMFLNVIWFLTYRDLKFWPLEGDFTDAFLKIEYNCFLRTQKLVLRVNAQKLVLRGFGWSREIHFGCQMCKNLTPFWGKFNFNSLFCVNFEVKFRGVGACLQHSFFLDLYCLLFTLTSSLFFICF